MSSKTLRLRSVMTYTKRAGGELAYVSIRQHVHASTGVRCKIYSERVAGFEQMADRKTNLRHTHNHTRTGLVS